MTSKTLIGRNSFLTEVCFRRFFKEISTKIFCNENNDSKLESLFLLKNIFLSILLEFFLEFLITCLVWRWREIPVHLLVFPMQYGQSRSHNYEGEVPLAFVAAFRYASRYFLKSVPPRAACKFQLCILCRSLGPSARGNIDGLRCGNCRYRLYRWFNISPYLGQIKDFMTYIFVYLLQGNTCNSMLNGKLLTPSLVLNVF